MARSWRGRRRDDVAEWLAAQLVVMFPPVAEFERRERERRAGEVRERWTEVNRLIAATRRGLEFDARMAARAEEVQTAPTRRLTIRMSPEREPTRCLADARKHRAPVVPPAPVHVAAQRQQAHDQAAQIAAVRNTVPG